MNSKNLIWSGAILVILIAIIVVSNLVSTKGPREETQQFFTGMKTDNLASFQVSDKDASVKVFRKGDVWMVSPAAKPAAADTAKKDSATATAANPATDTSAAVPGTTAAAAAPAPAKEYPADSAAVAVAVERLVKMQKEVLISENTDKQALFEVDNEKGLSVQVWDTKDKDLGMVLVGKNGSDWSSNYVRAQGSSKVYSVGGSLRSSLFTDIKRWRDKSVVKFDRSQAKKIVIQKLDRTIDIEKSSDSLAAWKFAGTGEKVKLDEVNKILDDLSNLNCTDWSEGESDSAMGFVKPEALVTVVLTNGDKKVLTVGTKKTGTSQFFVKAEGKTEIYLVNDWIINKFDVKPETLKEAPPADTAKAASAATEAKK